MKKKILMVCLGNICRSPAAQGILENKAKIKGLDLIVESAGTAAYHIGKQPDSRSIAELSNRGIDISMQRARQVRKQDFDEFDWVLAMDESNINNLQAICPKELQHKIHLFGAINKGENTEYFGEVADPYYGSDNGFVIMADHLEALAEHFLDECI